MSILGLSLCAVGGVLIGATSDGLKKLAVALIGAALILFGGALLDEKSSEELPPALITDPINIHSINHEDMGNVWRVYWEHTSA